MTQPIAFKMSNTLKLEVRSVSLDKTVAAKLAARPSAKTPAILAVTKVALLDQMSAGIFDDNDVQILIPGDWSNALLIVLPGSDNTTGDIQNADEKFLDWVDREAPDLSSLARELVHAIRSSGIEGDLQLEGHRWVNRPLNTFTLAVQKRVKNFQFTLYGGPERFGKSDFIKSDQNGYSRGWVRSRDDIQKFVVLASIAYKRKLRRL